MQRKKNPKNLVGSYSERNTGVLGFGGNRKVHLDFTVLLALQHWFRKSLCSLVVAWWRCPLFRREKS